MTSKETKRPSQSALAGPLRPVVYIFERAGVRGGPYWLLVLKCGHVVTRRRHNEETVAQALFRPLSEKLAPKRVQCHHCGSGAESHDPWVLIKTLGGGVAG